MMDTIRFDKKHARVIAHRGLSGLERENTIAAFIAAGNRSHYGIETDVHVTADGQLVVIHDCSTGRVANMDIVVEEHTLEQLRCIRINDQTGQGMAPRLDLCIPTLADYIDICHKYDKTAVLEIKTLFTEDALRSVIDVIQAHHHLEHTVFISFFWENLVTLRRLLPQQPLQFLTGPIVDERLEEMAGLHIDLDIHYPHLTADTVKRCHERGLEVNCWTCDDPRQAEELVAMGVDYITSNILE